LPTTNEEYAAVNFTVYNEELVAPDTLTTNNKELAVVATIATNDEELDATIALAAIKTYVNVELAENYNTVKNTKTAQKAKSKFAINTCRNILKIIKNNCANSKKIAVVVYSVEAEIEEVDVEQQKAGTTALTSPQNTKNYVDVVTIKRTQAEKVVKTILPINTVAPKTETTNKFKNQNSLRLAPTNDFSKNVTQRLT
jgi:hypothetical protein